jgi:hypothetical protein
MPYYKYRTVLENCNEKKDAAVLLGFGFVFAPPFAKATARQNSHEPLWACSFAQASRKYQNFSLRNGSSMIKTFNKPKF